MVPGELGPNSTIARANGWVVETLGSELVMLDPARDRYLRLNRTGGLIWVAMEEPATVAELAAGLAETEGIPRDLARRDVIAFVSNLIDHGAAEYRD